MFCVPKCMYVSITRHQVEAVLENGYIPPSTSETIQIY